MNSNRFLHLYLMYIHHYRVLEKKKKIKLEIFLINLRILSSRPSFKLAVLVGPK